MDLPISKRSLSLSCSDKLALYNLIGIQGKHLFRYFCPIYINLFLIKTNNFNQDSIKNGTNFVKRISYLLNKN